MVSVIVSTTLFLVIVFIVLIIFIRMQTQLNKAYQAMLDISKTASNNDLALQQDIAQINKIIQKYSKLMGKWRTHIVEATNNDRELLLQTAESHKYLMEAFRNFTYHVGQSFVDLYCDNYDDDCSSCPFAMHCAEFNENRTRPDDTVFMSAPITYEEVDIPEFLKNKDSNGNIPDLVTRVDLRKEGNSATIDPDSKMIVSHNNITFSLNPSDSKELDYLLKVMIEDKIPKQIAMALIAKLSHMWAEQPGVIYQFSWEWKSRNSKKSNNIEYTKEDSDSGNLLGDGSIEKGVDPNSSIVKSLENLYKNS